MAAGLPHKKDFMGDYLGTTWDIEPWINWSESLEAKWDAAVEANEVQLYDANLFPYQATGPLEFPLPTLTEIAAAPPIKGRVDVKRIGPYFVKFATTPELFQEAENMIYLERNSTVRTAKLYAAFTSQEADPLDKASDPDHVEGKRYTYFYIITECIDGVHIYHLLDELDTHEDADRHRMCLKVSDMMGEQLRRLRDVPPEDPNHFGRVNGGAYFRQPFIQFPEDPDAVTDFGPWNYEQMVDRMIHNAKVFSATTAGFGGDFKPLSRELLTNARTALIDSVKPSDRLPVLSHLDTHLGNVMAKVVRDDKGKLIDIEEVLWVDWATMCWAPAWYEPGKFNCYDRHEDKFIRVNYAWWVVDKMGHVPVLPYAYIVLCLKNTTFRGTFL